MAEIIKIGLTGGIASGKSLVASYLSQAGITVIDMDLLGRELTEKNKEILKRINDICGGGVLADQGLDRRKVKEILFANPAAKKAIEALLHPQVLKEFEDRARALEVDGKKIVVGEAALLVETGYAREFKEVILVTAPETIRRERVRFRDGLPEDLILRILAAQLPDEAKKKAATWILENSGSPEDLRREVQKILTVWTKRNWLD